MTSRFSRNYTNVVIPFELHKKRRSDLIAGRYNERILTGLRVFLEASTEEEIERVVFPEEIPVPTDRRAAPNLPTEPILSVTKGISKKVKLPSAALRKLSAVAKRHGYSRGDIANVILVRIATKQ